MEQNDFWEDNRFSTSQEIARILWKPKVHYRDHNCPPPVAIASSWLYINANSIDWNPRSKFECALNICENISSSNKLLLPYRIH